MENSKERKILYLVSFGESDTYRYVYTDTYRADDLRNRPAPLQKEEEELKNFLYNKFPQDSALAYYYTPKLLEVSWENYDRYAGYPEFDDNALQAIKKVLVKEVSNDLDLAELNNNAPQADAPV